MLPKHLQSFSALFVLASAWLLSVANAQTAAQWQQETEHGEFVIRIAPEQGDVRIGEFQSWKLSLQDKRGRAVRGATIEVGGGMRGHGHGLPTQPIVSGQMRAGEYRIEGLKLNMPGKWTFSFSIRTANTSDRALIDLNLTTDGAFRSQLQSLTLPVDARPPPSPSNSVADNAEAAALGKRVFFDKRFSANGEISCATCHVPGLYFVDGRKRGQGTGEAMRNTPTLVGAAYQSWFYWDGRRDSLWSQALVPFEAADEMGISRTAVVRQIYEDDNYRALYALVFGELPSGLDHRNWPAQANPLGDAAMRDAWHQMDRRQRDMVDDVYANIGKAIAAYERTIAVPRSRFDGFAEAYLSGDPNARSLLTDDERLGLQLFVDDAKTNCLRCHNGPLFTNNGFSNIGTGRFFGEDLDFGRVYGLQSAVRDVFNCMGPHSDAHRDDCKEWRYLNRSSHVPLEGAYKVPSLRGLTFTAPYMHDGRFETLEEVINHYRAPPRDGPPHELLPMPLTKTEVQQLVAFLKTISGGQ